MMGREGKVKVEGKAKVDQLFHHDLKVDILLPGRCGTLNDHRQDKAEKAKDYGNECATNDTMGHVQ